jgi:hypothetical protein
MSYSADIFNSHINNKIKRHIFYRIQVKTRISTFIIVFFTFVLLLWRTYAHSVGMLRIKFVL